MDNKKASEKRLAIIFQSLYLANLLLLPGISFMVLLWYLFKQKTNIINWYTIHLYRAIQLSLCAGVMLIVLPATYIIIDGEYTVSLMVMLVYFVTLHTLFVLLGMLNIARAMARKTPLF